MFLDINRYPNEFSNKISEALYTRIKARRNSELVGLMKYLSNSKIFTDKRESQFQYQDLFEHH